MSPLFVVGNSVIQKARFVFIFIWNEIKQFIALVTYNTIPVIRPLVDLFLCGGLSEAEL
jgi:hypothetical protein